MRSRRDGRRGPTRPQLHHGAPPWRPSSCPRRGGGGHRPRRPIGRRGRAHPRGRRGAGLDGALSGSGPHTRFSSRGRGSPMSADLPPRRAIRSPGLRPGADRRQPDLGDAPARGRQHHGCSVPRPRQGYGGGQKTVTTRYSYFANLAVGLCEGEIALVRRIWADGKETRSGRPDHPGPYRRPGSGARPADRRQGGGGDRARLSRPRLRGVREPAARRFRQPHPAIRLRGDPPGQRAVRPHPRRRDDPRRQRVRPRSGSRHRRSRPRPTEAANRHQLQRATDVLASLDALQALCPNLRRVAVVATWFGTDMRAGSCRVVPKVEGAPAGRCRRIGASPGSPRGCRGRLDPAGRQPVLRRHPERRRPDPAGGRAGRPRPGGAALPLRDDGRAGRQRPARSARARGNAAALSLAGARHLRSGAGRPGEPDGTGAADAQVAAFFANGYTAEVLHYADLAAQWAANGIQIAGFVIGSEYVGLTRVRGASGYPAVQAFRAIAAAVRARLGPGVALVYGADWTEYGAHVVDGGATIRFPLDDLFADPNIAAVGIDWYAPVSDWRDTPDHADLAATGDIYDRAYLKARGASGEAFDWYYPTRRPAPPRPAARSPTAPPQALDLPGQGPRGMVVEPACRAGRRRRDPGHRLGADGKADLAHRTRRAGGRQGHERPPTSSPIRNRSRTPTRRNPGACATS